MSLRSEFGATPGAAISAAVTPTINCGGASGVLVHILTTSSLTITAQIAADGSSYSTIPITNVKTGDVTAAGTAITVSANDLYFIPTYGAEKAQIVRGAGSGTLSARPVFATGVADVAAGAVASASSGFTASLGNEFESTVAGNAATKVPTTDSAGRLAVVFRNPDVTYDLWVELVATGGGTPTMTVNSIDYAIPPGQSLTLTGELASSNLDYYCQNSTGAATTTNAHVREVVI